MLRQALRLIASGRVTGVDGLAAALKVAPPLADQLLADLMRLGYLQAPDPSCRPGCGDCPLAKKCASPLLLTLTDRGRRASTSLHA